MTLQGALAERLLALSSAVLAVGLAWAQYNRFEQSLDAIRGRRARPDPVSATAP